ncbi:MAG: thermonuclease family protein [Syntrophaceae bacterium]|nr:thermonuclease family protein [Syntrophaceae bacterium]
MLLVGITAFLLTSLSFAREPIRTVTGTVTKISDGDTIQITTPKQTKLRVRLYGIDAPETPKPDKTSGRINKPGQPYGKESWKALERKIKSKRVKLDIVDIDQYQRMVGIVWLDNRNINLEMVREGYAEAYTEFLKRLYRSQYLSAQQEAQLAKRGIWGLPDYERPRDFKKRLNIR